MIGGTDVVFWVGEDVPVADVVFRTIRRYWPNYGFQNADDESVPFIPHHGFGIPSPSCDEFFVYRDERAALDWDEYGATPENKNLMVYVIQGERRQPELGLRSVTIVVGSPDDEMQHFLNELKDRFLVLTVGTAPNTREPEATAA